ncbi:MAG: NAD(P)H-dependent oxidoreductase [Defluviitaleaceae bacterium]|nr:NAD(P)H-dependent oxidoreductase [Defluviitaleaceae bacterium]
MHILIINGTPKTDGLCYSFVQAAEQATLQAGSTFETVNLKKINLDKCKMCGDGWGICFKEHYCVFGEKDGFSQLQAQVEKATAFIYITPVYWGEISEEFKIFLDKLRRCEATKQWDSREDRVSFLHNKPSIMVASAGGGGGGIVTTFADIERAISQMGGDAWPREKHGIFDYIAVNRWNKPYKLTALKSAIAAMIAQHERPQAVSVAAQADYTLLCKFDNGEERIFDIKPYLEKKPFNELTQNNLFENVIITGVHIEWRPGISIEISELYDN